MSSNDDNTWLNNISGLSINIIPINDDGTPGDAITDITVNSLSDSSIPPGSIREFIETDKELDVEWFELTDEEVYTRAAQILSQSSGNVTRGMINIVGFPFAKLSGSISGIGTTINTDINNIYIPLFNTIKNITNNSEHSVLSFNMAGY